MRKLTCLLAVVAILCFGAFDVAAQENIVESNGEMSINNADGESIVKIKSDENDGSMIISFATFNLVIDGKKSEPSVAVNYFSQPLMPPLSGYFPKQTKFMSANYLSLAEVGINMMSRVDYSMYQNMPAELDEFMRLSGKSLQFSFSLWRATMFLNTRKNLALTTGLQIGCNNYVFSGNVTLRKDNGMLVPEAISPQYKKSKLVTSFLQIPVLFSVGKPNSFYISVGLYGGLILESHSKIKFPKEKMYSLYMNPFYYGATARLGYGKIYVYANYGLSGMFQRGRGPVALPLTLGVGLGF